MHERGLLEREVRERPLRPVVEQAGEETVQRILTQGLLAKGTTFEIIVSGKVGLKEIETLIRKLQIDKELLADESDEKTEIDLKLPGLAIVNRR